MPAKRAQFTRLEIAGGIASGKTTLARLLKRAGVACILEDFRRNPFIQAFYRTPRLVAFETELSFVLQHFHALKTRRDPGSIAVLDHSFYLDEAYADVTLRGRERRTHQSVLDEIRRQAKGEALVVHLECSAPVELRRIRARRREMEKGISKAYLEALNAAVTRRLSEVSPHRVFRLDSTRFDYAHDSTTRRTVRADLMQWLTERAYCK